jgi:fucose 4-O-acetylase-like acetyltransferase
MSGPAMPGGRRLDMDALRIGACLTQFVFHTGKVFDTDPVYHVKNAVLSPAVNVITTFTHLWRMPLFFLIAGWATIVVLRRRTTRRFLRERVHRLVPPLLFGIIVLCPPIKFVERLGEIDNRPDGHFVNEPFHFTFLEFLPRFFTRLSVFSWSHMWFLVYLLLFSLLLLPLLRRLSSGRDRLGGATWLVYAPLLPLMAFEVVLRPIWGDFPNLYSDWANLAAYLTYFLIGAVLASEPRLEARLARDCWLLGLIAALGLVARLTGFGPDWLRHLAAAVAAWGCVGFMVGAAHRWWRRDGPLVRYLSEATLPLYVLHHTPSVVLAFLIVGLPLSLWAKLALLFVGSILSTFALYHFCIRPWPAMRFLLGMRTAPPPAATAAGVEAQAGLQLTAKMR